MDKRLEANLLVQNKLTDALFKLLTKKSISEISITELVKCAGVARASFYRNYESVYSILTAYIDRISEDFTDTNPVKRVDFSNYDYMLHVFHFYMKIKDRIMCIHNAGLSSLLLQAITDYNIAEAGDMSCHSIKRYELYYYSGALYNVLIHWMQNGVRETESDMAQKFCQMVSSESQ